MEQDILDYIKEEPVGVIALEMLDGAPHAATVHIANINDPLTFIVLTSHDSRKGKVIQEKKTTRASLVIGLTEGNMKTLQMDGVATLVQDNKILQEAYWAKFPKKLEKFPNDLFFSFTPTWWRFTDWTGPKGKQIRTSA